MLRGCRALGILLLLVGCETEAFGPAEVTAEAGTDQTTRVGETLVLVGNGTGPAALTFEWKIVAPRGGTGLTDAELPGARFSPPEAGIYVLSLTAFSAGHPSDPDYMNVRVLTCVDGDGDTHLPISCGGGDCDDQDPDVHPGEPEVCNDGKDNDCNGDSDCADATCTGAPNCGCDTQERSCSDGVDDDCDGDTDCADIECDARVCGTNGLTCLSGSCACPTGTVESACTDGVDDDCDGDIDCADADCDTTTCGANGLTCVSGACACPGGEASETSCSDGGDNDCDGDVDCADSNCAGVPPCSCAGSESACNDGVDNDCDGDTDCDDAECNGSSCAANGFLCNGSSCACPGPATEGTCDDGVDEDCDGNTDCVDADCDGQTCGGNGLTCAAGACACPLGELTEATCNDGNDNDCDGDDDCADADCNGAACAVNGLVCVGTSCQCPGPGSEAACTDGVDEDCDGATDCADGDCNGQSCGANGELCSSGACNCPGGATESACGDSADDDCDGSTDCADNDCDGLSCGANGELCSASVCSCPSASPEIACTGGVDDDCDGATDCADIDCQFDIACACSPSGPTETDCSDTVDDDCDGSTDCADSDCFGALCGTSNVCRGGSCQAVPTDCAALLAVAPGAPSGLWLIDPDGAGGAAPFQVWCDMVIDSGGWTLVGRSESGGGGSMGWRQTNGSPAVDTAPYSMDVESSGLVFTQILFGNYTTGKTLGPNAYRHDVPANLLTAFGNSAFDTAAAPTVILGGCSPLAGAMFRWIGRTNRTDTFFFRDNAGDSNFGLRNNQWGLNFTNCTQAGNLNGDQGMLFVR